MTVIDTAQREPPGGYARPARLVDSAEVAANPIERVVWSFWSSPFLQRTGMRWANEFCHLLSWILSFRLASELFTTTALVTDETGRRLLIDQLGLPFDEVTLTLDSIAARDPAWWSLGKLYAYREQSGPFLHIDNDVFLWPGFPARSLSGHVVAQNPEFAPTSDSTYYKPSSLAATVRNVGGWLPTELDQYIALGGETALCTGIFGGTALPLIRRYAEAAIQLIESPVNQGAWMRLIPIEPHNVVAEQYLLGAMCWGESDLDVQCLFQSQDDAFDSRAARKLAYTHLIAFSKSDPTYVRHLARRVLNDYPRDYEMAIRAAALGKAGVVDGAGATSAQ